MIPGYIIGHLDVACTLLWMVFYLVLPLFECYCTTMEEAHMHTTLVFRISLANMVQVLSPLVLMNSFRNTESCHTESNDFWTEMVATYYPRHSLCY